MSKSTVRVIRTWSPPGVKAMDALHWKVYATSSLLKVLVLWDFPAWDSDFQLAPVAVGVRDPVAGVALMSRLSPLSPSVHCAQMSPFSFEIRYLSKNRPLA